MDEKGFLIGLIQERKRVFKTTKELGKMAIEIG
jgi:hypothetical protein